MLNTCWPVWLATVVCAMFSPTQRTCKAQPAVHLPQDVNAVWDMSKAYRETTPTRERISINGLWRWQPAGDRTDKVPTNRWGYFKVPGSWPGISNYMQKDCQTVYAHPNWRDENLARITAAWYQREITVPDQWSGHRITVRAEYLNSYAAVYVDGKRAGEMRFPRGEVDLTSACRPGEKHLLSLLVVAMPLQGVMLSYNDTNSARNVKGTVARRGLCGDVCLVATPAADAMYRNNRPLLAYLAGKPTRFTSKDHNFLPDETVEKQIIVINNSRESVTAQCVWSFGLPRAATGSKQVTVAPGEQEHVLLRFELPADLAPGAYALRATIKFNTSETQRNRFVIHVRPPSAADRHRNVQISANSAAKIALFDPKGETRKLLAAMGASCQSVEAGADLSQYDLLIIGKAALTPEGPAPDMTRVRDGLKVIVFEQTSEALEKRLGFRV